MLQYYAPEYRQFKQKRLLTLGTRDFNKGVGVLDDKVELECFLSSNEVESFSRPIKCNSKSSKGDVAPHGDVGTLPAGDAAISLTPQSSG